MTGRPMESVCNCTECCLQNRENLCVASLCYMRTCSSVILATYFITTSLSGHHSFQTEYQAKSSSTCYTQAVKDSIPLTQDSLIILMFVSTQPVLQLTSKKCLSQLVAIFPDYLLPRFLSCNWWKVQRTAVYTDPCDLCTTYLFLSPA